jgi:hypothetical protein
MSAFHDALLASGLASPYHDWLREWDTRPGFDQRITTRVECGRYFGVRDDALRAHATQIDPDSHWFAVPLDLRRRLWPTEDFELAKSHVDTQVPEDDLFAGIEPTAENGEDGRDGRRQDQDPRGAVVRPDGPVVVDRVPVADRGRAGT